MTTALPDTSASLVAAAPPRAYGTFEVSLVDLEGGDESATAAVTGADRQHQHAHRARSVGDSDEKNEHDDDDSKLRCGGVCSQEDCCFAMAFLCAPVRLQTYKVLVFHAANFAFAVVAAAWTIALVGVKLAAGCRASAWGPSARRLESRSLRTLLRVDTALFNFVSPAHERVKVYSSSTTSFQDVNLFFGFHAQLYFGVAKLASSALPGAISATMFVWSLQRLFVIVLCALTRGSSGESCDAALFTVPDDGTSVGLHFLTTAAQDLDVLVLLGVLAVLGAAMLMKVFAYISRHVTIFFCAEHLLYAAPV